MVKNKNLEGRAYVAIGLMLFALFFGAGNLIFPASMGQNAGVNVWWAMIGFLITGIGMPLLSVVALGYSGSKDVKELASRVHPLYGLLFAILLYITIGPAFAIPRTGTVSYEIAVRPFLASGGTSTELTIFMVIFIAISWWLSSHPNKLVGRIGKVLTPALLLTILLLIAKSFITPMGAYQMAMPEYGDPSVAIIQGFLDGYNTMDVLAGLTFGVLVVDFVKMAGAANRSEIMSATLNAGAVAVVLLGAVYLLIGHLGASSVEQLGILKTGAPVLTGSAEFLFGYFGAIILAVIVLLACLSTSVGLITACAAFFSDAIGGLSYLAYVALFSIVSGIVGLFGLETIIVAAIPILIFLYPLAIVLIFLTFADGAFNGRQCVYAWTVGCTFIISLISGLEAANINLGGISTFLTTHVPMHVSGMSWVWFAVIGFIIGILWKAIFRNSTNA